MTISEENLQLNDKIRRNISLFLVVNGKLEFSPKVDGQYDDSEFKFFCCLLVANNTRSEVSGNTTSWVISYTSSQCKVVDYISTQEFLFLFLEYTYSSYEKISTAVQLIWRYVLWPLSPFISFNFSIFYSFCLKISL